VFKLFESHTDFEEGAAQSKETRWAGVALSLAAGGLLASVLLGLLVPIYTDEVLWRMHLRALIDGGFDSTYNDLCGPNTVARPPWTMLPVRWFSATLNQALAAPLFVRLSGVACALALVALVWAVLCRLAPDRERRRWIGALVFALLGLGFMPFLLVLSRPEQPIVLAMTLAILIVFVRRDPPPAMATAQVAVIVAAGAVAMSYHAKGVLYLPVALGCVWFATRGTRLLPVRFGGLLGLLAVAATAIPYWVARFSCPGDPLLAETLAGENIAIVVADKGWPAGLLAQLPQGLDPLAYPLLTAPKPLPTGDWMPPNLVSPAMSHAFTLGIAAIWLASFALAGARCWIIARSSGRRAWREPRLVLPLAILACVFVWGISQVNRNDYEAGHVVPMLVLALAMALTLPGKGRLLRPVALAAVLVAVVSQVTVAGLTAAPLWRAAQRGGYVETQDNSVSVAAYAQVRTDIRKAMRAAGIPHDRRLRRLLVDDLTYLALQDSYRPFHRVGVLSDFTGSIQHPAAYLADRGSDGIVVGCKYLPLELVRASSGDICAVSGPVLKRAATLPEAAASFDDLQF
jgi:hypothetical protein